MPKKKKLEIKDTPGGGKMVHLHEESFPWWMVWHYAGKAAKWLAVNVVVPEVKSLFK